LLTNISYDIVDEPDLQEAVHKTPALLQTRTVSRTQQFPPMTCEPYVTMAADSSLSVSTLHACLLKRLSRSEMAGCLAESRLIC